MQESPLTDRRWITTRTPFERTLYINTDVRVRVQHLREYHGEGRRWTRNLKDGLKEFFAEAGSGISLTLGALWRLISQRGRST